VAEATPVEVPTVRTVPPGTPVPAGGAALPTRPVKNPQAEAEKKAGKAVGPVITHMGAARADGFLTKPVGKDSEGVPIYQNPVGSGFMIVIEGKPGISNLEVGRSIFKYGDPRDPSQRPDLEIEVNRPLGDGSPAVCDAKPPNFGGVPAINPPSFADNPTIDATLNDFSCRFETFIESSGACTVNKNGDFEFAEHDTKVQFCIVIARAWNFPEGETLVSARLRDIEGNPGPVSRFIMVRKPNPTPPPRPKATATPTVSRRRE
jgi:hypothetical protein